MSTSIRPPGGPLAPSIGGIEGPSAVQPGEPAPVEQAGAAGAVAASEAPAAEGPTATVLARLEAGELTREQAIDTLVGQALALHGGNRLPPAQRAELASVLRAALLDDPTLASLLG